METTQDQVLIALRQIMRAVDLHSRQLLHSHKLTGPQALILRVLLRSSQLTLGQLARQVSLSPATVTDVINRLETRGLVVRVRSTHDKRQVFVTATEAAAALLADEVPLLQDRFVARFQQLQTWEQMLLLSSLQRIASMMDASDIDAAPVLAGGSLTASPLDEAEEDLSRLQQVAG
ncbi:MAG: MarR family transcriptional regulator [Gammaproteobacteria bacterium]|nr:MarR family transcriptional regulator [Gammaproteobacteria bacterium]